MENYQGNYQYELKSGRLSKTYAKPSKVIFAIDKYK